MEINKDKMIETDNGKKLEEKKKERQEKYTPPVYENPAKLKGNSFISECAHFKQKKGKNSLFLQSYLCASELK